MGGPGALGAWEDRPRRNSEADLAGVPLDNKAAFVLTRIDGLASIADLCAMSGFGEDETLAILTRLRELGLIAVDKAPERRAPPPQPTPTPAPVGTGGAQPGDRVKLRRYGKLGEVPAVPVRRPGDGPHGTFVFDRRELLEGCDLTLEQKKDVLFYWYNLDKMDHFELLAIDPTVDRKELKRGYFQFSKRFHPDTFFRKDTGSFGERIQKIFKHVTEIHDKLQSETDLREAYARLVAGRNAELRAKLDAERVARETERAVREAEAAEAAKREAEARKSELQARLGQRVEARRSRPEANPMMQRLNKAEQYYAEGMAQYREEKFIQAVNSIQLAITFDPKNETYKQALEKVNEKARQVRAEVHWKRGDMLEQIGRTREALAEFKQAVEFWARADYLAHTADLLYQNDEDLTRAADLARQATELAPQNVDYLLLLGKIYQQAKVVKRAIGVFEKVLKLEPDHEIAKKHLKALKRM